MAEELIEKTDLHVLIVGTGVTGLVIAQGLKKAGIGYTILESDTSLARADGDNWGMAIHWALPALASCLDAESMAKIHTCQVDPHYSQPEGDIITIRNGQTGEIMKELPIAKMYRLSRNKIRHLCADGVDIQFSKSLSSIDTTSPDTITVHSADGSMATGSVLIGTDGARSTVRRLLVPGPSGAATPAPYTACRVLARYPSATTARLVRSLHPINTMAIHPQGIWSWISVLDIPDPEDPTSWAFQLMASWPSSRDAEPHEPGAPRKSTTLAALQAKMALFVEPFCTAFASIPPGTSVRTNQTSYWEPPSPPDAPWHNFEGRATLAGDAAHPMTFHRAQGLNHAVTDAANFVKAMEAVKSGEKSLSEAVKGYEEEVVRRGGEEVRLSLRNTMMLHDWEMVLNSPLMQKGTVKG